MDARLLARVLACIRIGIGITLFAAPRTAARRWIGDDLSRSASVLTRGLGARDLVIGVGQLVAVDDPEHDLDSWLDAGIAADAADATGALLSRRDLSTSATVSTVAIAGSAVALGLFVKRALAAAPE